MSQCNIGNENGNWLCVSLSETLQDIVSKYHQVIKLGVSMLVLLQLFNVSNLMQTPVIINNDLVNVIKK